MQINSRYLFWENAKRFIYFLRPLPHFFFLYVRKEAVNCQGHKVSEVDQGMSICGIILIGEFQVLGENPAQCKIF